MPANPLVALVTGASSGIGRAIALKLAQEGYRLALGARRLERLEELATELQALGAEVLIQAVDLRQEADILAFFQAIRQRWGGVDVLINNAGLGHKQSLLDGDTEAWRDMLEVNVLALCICTREATRDMRQRGGKGHVVHISSMSGHRVPGGSGVYSATKFAVRSLTEGLTAGTSPGRTQHSSVVHQSGVCGDGICRPVSPEPGKGRCPVQSIPRAAARGYCQYGGLHFDPTRPCSNSRCADAPHPATELKTCLPEDFLFESPLR
jgi:NADP-dependent 3-hydroxy acid dehydrogenase YdfG